MTTVEDIERVIHRIRYGGAGLDVQLLAVEYLSKARAWKKKAEFADLIMASFNEELPPEKALEFFRCRTSLNKRYAWLGEVTAKAEKFDAFKDLYDEHHISGSKATHRWQTFLLKIHDVLGES